MNTSKMNSFAAGLFVATAICSAAYFLEPNEVTSDGSSNEVTSIEKFEKPSETEMKNILASSGYVIHSEEEWKEQLAAMDSVEAKDEPVDEEKETTVYRTILNVSSGMTSIDVGKVLVQASITDDAMAFFYEVEKRGLSSDLRPGTYEISSDMTVDEVIATVFKIK